MAIIKKVFLFAVLGCAATFTAHAQKTTFGLRVGANYSTTHLNDKDDIFSGVTDGSKSETKYLAGLNLGLVSNIKFSNAFSLQPELHYSQQGDIFEITWPDKPSQSIHALHSKSTYRMNYLHLPVLAKYSFGGENIGFFAIAGPYAGYWISGKSKYERTYREGSTIIKTEGSRKVDFTSSGTNRLDFGLVAGLGIAKSTGLGQFTFDVRYNHGLFNLADGVGNNIVTNRFFSAGVGYMLGSK